MNSYSGWKIMVTLSVLLAPSLAFAGGAEVKGCLKSAFAKPNPIYQVPEMSDGNGRFFRYLAIICDGDSAKDLYEAIKEESTPGDWSGKTKGEVKYLSMKGDASFCYHITRDADGERADQYSCSIRLNIAERNLGKTVTDGMNPFDLK